MNNDGSKIPVELLELVEKLSESIHEAWSAQRLTEGWRYGAQRDDLKKEHPCLVPYKDLPESEKEYDRKTALKTIQTILGWGFRIESPASPLVGAADRTTPAPPEDVTEVQRLWQDLPHLDLPQTLQLWQALRYRTGGPLRLSHAEIGHHLLRLGEPLMAYDLISEGLQSRPQDPRLRSLQALALLRSGAVEQASKLLQKLYDEGRRDKETMGLLARVSKELAGQATDPTAKKWRWRLAYELYAAAYEQTGGYWTGINAATIARYLGEKEEAVALSHRVTEQCLLALPGKAADPGELYWLQVTLGEAALIREEWQEAENWYTQASRGAAGRYGDLASTRRNVRLLLEVMRVTPAVRERLEGCFRISPVVVFSGHMIDQPGRPQPRFPDFLEQQVARKIADTLERLYARIGVSSAACGGDILFLEAMQDRGGETIVVLPIRKEEFRQTSVDIIPGADWSQRFDRVIEHASRLIIASEYRTTGDELTYSYANLIQDGLAILRARAMDTEVIPLVVWDGKTGDRSGGTASLVQHWQTYGLEPEVINTIKLFSEISLVVSPAGPVKATGRRGGPPRSGPSDLTQELKAILFADVVGSGRIREEQVPAFVDHFMGAIYNLLAASPHKPLLTNTWGDALYAVFASIQDAGNFALQLRDRISSTNWRDQGLPHDINLRISLHAGPVYCYEKPFFRELAYTGSHIVWAAGIEPITPPGQVYASQQFAALASAQRVEGYFFEYVGQVPLPKQSGIIPLYLVHRNNR